MGFNYIYDKLVENDGDFQGLVAYGIYKRHKIEFINSIKKEKNTSKISDEDLYSFHISSNSPSQIESYKLQANKLLSGSFMAIMEEQLKEAEADFHYMCRDNLKNAMPKPGKTIFISVLSSLIASIVIGSILMFFSFKVSIDSKLNEMREIEKRIKETVILSE